MAGMGRKRTSNTGLPPRMHIKRGRYYYVTTTPPRKWIPLGADRADALRNWASLEGEAMPAGVRTLQSVWERYAREIVPLKADATQRDNLREAEKLLAVFGGMAVDAITAQHVRRYMDLREAKIRAKREKALLSHIINKAREWGISDAPNPCAGIRGASTPGRDRYIDDAEYARLWQAADEPLRDAMDLALLTGQRPADVLKMDRTQLRDGVIWIRQNKTGKKLRVIVEGELRMVIDRCTARAAGRPVASLYLVQSASGQRVSYRSLADRFSKARSKSGVANVQFRDIRAKSGTDLDSLEQAQKLLGHKGRAMTEHYLRERVGETVRPLARVSTKPD